MFTILVADNEEKAKKMLAQILEKNGKQEIRDYRGTLEDKISELEGVLFQEKRGAIYKSFIDAIEKPFLERVLERTEGNQLKAAKILGINRNTMRSKIRRLGIDPDRWKVSS